MTTFRTQVCESVFVMYCRVHCSVTVHVRAAYMCGRIISVHMCGTIVQGCYMGAMYPNIVLENCVGEL